MSDPTPTLRAVAAGEGTTVGAADGAVRAGVRLAGAAGISLVANYLFLLGAGRLLGSGDYGTVAALLGVLTVVLLPSGALQMAVSREVSRLEAVGESEAASAFSRALLFVGLKAAIPLTLLAFVLAVPLRELLGIGATAPVLIALTSVSVAIIGPAALGLLQGYQRFRALAFISALPMVARLALLVVLAIAGARLYGALLAIAVSAVAGGALSLWAVRDRLRARPKMEVAYLRPFFRYLWPVAVGLLGISLLTNVDILIAKARFSSEDAGAYAAASAFARVAFFLPATILSVLFPRAAARHARGEDAGDILGRALIVTAAFCGVLTAGYALLGDHLVRLTYGAEFASAAGLLVPFSVAMALFSIANVLAGYHLSRGNTRFVWVIAAAVAVQVALLATVPTSLRGLVWIDFAIGVGLVVVHEVTMGSSASALVAGFEELHVGSTVQQAFAAVARLRAAFVESVIVLAGYSALAVAVTWPLAAHLHDRLLGKFPNDGAGGAAWFWQLQHEGGYRFLGTTHHTLTGAPLGWDQGNALNFQWLWPDYPAYLISTVVGPVATINLIVLSGFALSGAAMYLLIRWLGCGRLVAAWAGLVYVIFPWHLHRALAGHVTLVHLEIFPLLLLAALAWVRRPTDGRALLVAAAVTGAWLTSGYFGTIALLALVGVSLVGLWAHRRALGTPAAMRKAAVLWAGALVGAMALTAIAVFAGGTTGVALGKSAGDLGQFGAHLSSYLPDTSSSLFGWIAGHPARGHGDRPGTEVSLYPGLLTLILALGWVAARRRRRIADNGVAFATATLVAVVIVAVVFALPNPVEVFGLRLHPMPSLLTFKLVPAFRVPTRLAALGMAALVALAALGLAQLIRALTRRFGNGRAVATVVCGAACALSVVELGIVPLPMASAGTPPPVYAAVARTPPGVLAEYPLDDAGTFHSSGYIFWQRIHGRPLLNGPGSGTSTDAIRRMLVDPAAPGTASSLSLLGVTAIVTRPTTFEWNGIKKVPDTPSYGPGYALAEGFPGDVRVWRVTARPAPAVAAYRSRDVGEAQARTTDGFVGYQVFVDTVHVDIYAKAPGIWRLRFDVRSRPDVLALRIVGKTGARVVPLLRSRAVSVPIAIERGKSTVLLVPVFAAAGGSTAPSERLLLTSPWFARMKTGVGERAIHPAVLARNPGF